MSGRPVSIKPLLKDISAYTFGDVLTKGLGFLSIIVYTYFLTEQEMGAYGYLMVILGFCNTFLILGLDNALARFYFEKEQLTEKAELSSTIFIFIFSWFGVLFFVYLMVMDYINTLVFDAPVFQSAILWGLLTLPFKLLSILSNQLLRNQFKKRLFVGFNVATAVITIGSAVLLLWKTDLGIKGIFLSVLLGDLLVLPFRLRAVTEFLILRFNFSLLKEVLAYGVPFLPVSIAYWVFSGADRFMLEQMTDFATVGRYTVAVTLSGVMSVLAGGIANAWSPIAVKTYEEDQAVAKVLYARFLKVLIFFPLIFIAGMCFLGKEVFSLILSKEYQEIFYPTLLIIIGISFKLSTQVTASGISLKKKTKYFTYITLIIAFLNIGLNYLLIPVFREEGAALATMISYIFLTFFYYRVSQGLFPVVYDKKYILSALFILIVLLCSTFLELKYRAILLFGSLVLVYVNRESLIQRIK